MSTLRQQIKEKIESNRPKLSPNSLKTYVSILFNLHKKHDTKDDEGIEWFNKNDNHRKSK